MNKVSEKTVISMRLVIVVFFFVAVGLPIFNLLSHVDFADFSNIVSTELFQQAMNNSLYTTTIATLISVAVAYILAYVINRSDIKRKAFITVLLTVPMLIPSISHGLGLINLFGVDGIVNKLLGTSLSIMGKHGIILGSVVYSFPVAFLILNDAFRYIDNTKYELCDVLGLNKFQVFMKVTLYYMRRPLISAVFAVFTMVFTDYGVPLAIGGRYSTLSTYLYREVIGLLDFSKGAIIGMFLLIPSFISFMFDVLLTDVSGADTNKQYNIKKNKVRDVLCSIFVWSIILLIALLFSSFVVMAFIKKYPYDFSFSLDHFKYVFSNSALLNLRNSLIIAFFSALGGTVLAYSSAYLSARVKSAGTKFLHILSMASLAIPGIVLGISFSMTFKGTMFFNSFSILILVNIIHFFASPYLLAYNALAKLNQDYEVVGTTCGINRIRIIMKVIIPSTYETIYEMFSYFFVNSMITISAVAFLFSIDTMPLSLLINQYEGHLMLEEAAIVSLLILLINIIVKGSGYIVKRYTHQREERANAS